MGTVCLYQAAAFFNSDFVRRKAELNLAYNLARYFRRDGRLGYVDDVGLAKLGAARLRRWRFCMTMASASPTRKTGCSS